MRFINKQLRATCSTEEQLLPMNTPGGPGGMGQAESPWPGLLVRLGEGQMTGGLS